MTDAQAPARPQIAIRAVDTGRINPHDPNQPPAITAISDEQRDFARLMVYGLEEPEVIEGQPIKAFWPLTMRQAARFLGIRLRRARDICEAPIFVEHYNKLVRQFRESERARNIATAVDIRDDRGDESAATKTVRLKAAQFIEGNDGKAGISVQINNNSGNRTIVAGYAIRLPADMPMPQRAAQIIDGTAEEISE